MKESPWEGAIRGNAILWSKNIVKPGNIFRQVISVTDWFPTLLKAANINHNVQKLDGIDLWDQIIGNNRRNFKRRIVHVLDEIFGYTSIRDDIWKYVNGSTHSNQYDEWLGAIGNETESFTDYTTVVRSSKVGLTLSRFNTLTNEKMDSIRSNMIIDCPNRNSVACKPLDKPCLFHIQADPCEKNNLAEVYPSIVTYFKKLVAYEQRRAVPSARIAFGDPASNPAFHNNTWTSWRSF